MKTALGALPPFLLTALRFALVGLVLAPFHRPNRAQLPAIAAIALVLGCGHFGLLFLALSGMDAASTAIVTQLGVPFSALLAWAVFGEKLGAARGLGLVLAFTGVTLLAGEPSLPHWAPLAIGVASMACWALSNVQVKRLGSIPPLALNGWMSLFAAPMLLVLSLLTEHGQTQALTTAAATPKVMLGVAYTVIASSLVAYTLWYQLLARHPMNRVVPVTLLGPVIGVAAGVLVLGEPLGWHKLVGGALTVAGVAVVQLLGGVVPPKDEPEPGT